MTKVNSLGVSVEDTSGLPVCLQKAAKSFTAPGSVATTRRVCPDSISASAFLARRIGKGQFRPLTSRSLSIWAVVMMRPFADIFESGSRNIPEQTGKYCPPDCIWRRRGKSPAPRRHTLPPVAGIDQSSLHYERRDLTDSRWLQALQRCARRCPVQSLSPSLRRGRHGHHYFPCFRFQASIAARPCL